MLVSLPTRLSPDHDLASLIPTVGPFQRCTLKIGRVWDAKSRKWRVPYYVHVLYAYIKCMGRPLRSVSREQIENHSCDFESQLGLYATHAACNIEKLKRVRRAGYTDLDPHENKEKRDHILKLRNARLSSVGTSSNLCWNPKQNWPFHSWETIIWYILAV